MEQHNSTVAERPAAKSKSNQTQPKDLPPYHVVLLDDNDHSYEYVMEMLRKLFGYDDPMGFSLAARVDKHGRAVIFTAHREYAELKREQVHGYGADWRVPTCQGSMSATLLPAEE